MAVWIWTLSILSYSCVTCGLKSKNWDSFQSKTELSHLTVNHETGTVYLGALNTLYQLTKDLKPYPSVEEVSTGPHLDNKKCTPPIDENQCTEAKMTDNYNKILLLDMQERKIVVCGSLFKGICSIRELENIANTTYYENGSGEKSFVASNDENVITVGLITSLKRGRMMFVGKGNGLNDNGVIISTRQLFNGDNREIFELYADHAAIKSAYPSASSQQFLYVFENNKFVYFIFNQNNNPGTINRTLIGRLCKDDESYHSYFEMDLECQDGSGPYNQSNAIYASIPVQIPGQDNEILSDTILIGLFRRMGKGSLECAMCRFSLKAINEKMEQNREKCYMKDDRDVFYKPFRTEQAPCITNSSQTFPCGSEHLPYPLGSKEGISAEPLLKKDGINLTAVTFTVENGKTVVFVGTSDGRILKVALSNPAKEYASILIEKNKPIQRDLVLDATHENLYVMTTNKVFRLPVQECASYSSCNQCIQAQDPYCGWCVTEGKCTRKKDCERSARAKNWLWSPEGVCLNITSANPQNMSRRAPGKVELTITPLPDLNEDDQIWCHFGNMVHQAELQGEAIICQPPDEIPPTPKGQGKETGAYISMLFKEEECPHFLNPNKCVWFVCNFFIVTLYSCSYGRDDCSLCLAAQYECVWCDARKSCVYKKRCLSATETCPPPVITQIEPKNGPLSGGILLTIMGSNLGITAMDVKNIMVADTPCTSTHEVQFTYQDPEPIGIHPQKGPQAGGTILTISGTNLDTGSIQDVKVYLDHEPCRVIKFGQEIVCVTGPNNREGPVSVTVQHGGTRKTIQNEQFTYTENPTVTKITPEASIRQTISKLNDTAIVFLSPPVLEDPENYRIAILIKMDGHVVGRDFQYVADPTFENFTDGIKKQVNKLIHAKGSNLNKAMTMDEARAFVGEEPCNITTLTEKDLYCEPPEEQPPPKRRQKRDTVNNLPEFIVKFGFKEWVLGRVEYTQVSDIPLSLILPLVIIPMVAIIFISIYCYRRKSQQAEREYEKIKSQLEGLEESVRDRCKKEFTDLMIEMEDQTNDINEARIPVLDYKTYTDRVFFLPSKDGEKDVMITGKLDIPEARRSTVEQALNQFSNLLNSKSFLITFIHTLENQREFSARAKVYFASLLTVALHGKLEYYTDIMRTLFLELMEQYVVAKNPKLMLRRSETVVERMLSNWMSICLYQYLKDNAGEPLYKLFKAIKHQVEKGPVDAVQMKAKYTLNDTGLLGDDVEYSQLTVNVIVQDEGTESVPVKVLNCDTISQVKEKIIDQVYRNLPYSQWPKSDSVVLEWRPGSTAQILSDLDLTSQRDGRWKRINTLMHYNVRDGATLILSKMGISQQPEDHQDLPGERHALLEEENKIWHLVRPVDEVDEGKSKRGSMKEKERTKAITEIYLTRLLSVKGTLQQFVDNFFHSVLDSNHVVPPAVKYFFDFLDEQAEKHDIKDEDTIHIWKTNSLPLRFWVNILKNPHFIFDVHVHEVVDASLSVIAQTFMDACTRTEHKLSRVCVLFSAFCLYKRKNVENYYKGIRQMVQVSDQDMNTHLAEISRAHTDSLNTLVALHQLYQYTNKYYDAIINALEEDPAAQKMQLAFRLQQIAAALENKVTDL
uniref:Plexin B2 n=1 Tax=Anolis carolinensis TaxID=28377 RepID=A0A803TWA8_ANOCA